MPYATIEGEREQDRRYYAENREKIIARNREWDRKNADSIASARREYRERNRVRLAEKRKGEWFRLTPQKRAEITAKARDLRLADPTRRPYVVAQAKTLLARSLGLKPRDITSEIAAAKVAQLEVKRAIRRAG